MNKNDIFQKQKKWLIDCLNLAEKILLENLIDYDITSEAVVQLAIKIYELKYR